MKWKEWMNEWMSEWVSEWVNEWMNEWMKATTPWFCTDIRILGVTCRESNGNLWRNIIWFRDALFCLDLHRIDYWLGVMNQLQLQPTTEKEKNIVKTMPTRPTKKGLLKLVQPVEEVVPYVVNTRNFLVLGTCPVPRVVVNMFFLLHGFGICYYVI